MFAAIYAPDSGDALIDVALRFGRQTFDFVAAFANVRGSATGWDAKGENADPPALRAASIPLTRTSTPLCHSPALPSAPLR